MEGQAVGAQENRTMEQELMQWRNSKNTNCYRSKRVKGEKRKKEKIMSARRGRKRRQKEKEVIGEEIAVKQEKKKKRKITK